MIIRRRRLGVLFPGFLEKFRKEYALSVFDISEKSGVSVRVIAKANSGQPISEIDINKIRKVLAKFEIKPVRGRNFHKVFYKVVDPNHPWPNSIEKIKVDRGIIDIKVGRSIIARRRSKS